MQLRYNGLFFCLVILHATVAAGSWRVEQAQKNVVLRGYTRSITTALISSEVGGRIKAIHYEIGDRIADKPFAEIDPTFVNFDIESTRVSIDQITTRLRQLQSRIDYLKREFERKEKLFEKGRSTEVVRDAAAQELDQARLEKERVMIEKRALEISLKQLLEKKTRHTINGRREWIVTDRKAEAGEVVQPGAPMAVMQDFRQLVIPLAVSNEELAAIKKKGQTFEARLEDTRATLSVYYVNPEFNERTRKTDIKLLVEDFNGEHRGGLRLTLPVRVTSAGLKIPAEAVTNRYANPKVHLEADGSEIPVTILDETEGDLIIATDPRLPVGTMLTSPKGQQP